MSQFLIVVCYLSAAGSASAGLVLGLLGDQANVLYFFAGLLSAAVWLGLVGLIEDILAIKKQVEASRVTLEEKLDRLLKGTSNEQIMSKVTDIKTLVFDIHDTLPKQGAPVESPKAQPVAAPILNLSGIPESGNK